MKLINSLSYLNMVSQLLKKKVRFISDCEIFPNFDVKVLVNDIHISKTSNEIIFETTNLSNKKHLTIGSNMKNLQFELL